MHIQECALVRAKIEDVPDNRVNCMIRNQALCVLQYRTNFLKGRGAMQIETRAHETQQRALSKRLHPKMLLKYSIVSMQSGLKPEQMRQQLGRFGLSGHHHLQPICKLSGGQKARVVFTSISLGHPHILLLDEPTNHLDMQSIDALAEALEQVSYVCFFSRRVLPDDDHLLLLLFFSLCYQYSQWSSLVAYLGPRKPCPVQHTLPVLSHVSMLLQCRLVLSSANASASTSVCCPLCSYHSAWFLPSQTLHKCASLKVGLISNLGGAQFEGGVVVISHDSQLLSRVCDDAERSEVWLVEDGEVERYDGYFEEYKNELVKEIADEMDDD